MALIQMFTLMALAISHLKLQHGYKNRQSMTARGYCSYHLEHCSKTNHVAIKGVIKRAKYENVFGLVANIKIMPTCFLRRAKYADLHICKDKTLGSLH